MQAKLLLRVRAIGLLGLALLSLIVSMAMTNQRVDAAPGDSCKVVLSLDVSDTMNERGPGFIAQIKAIFEAGDEATGTGGLGNRDDIDVALWTFSHADNAAAMNPNFINYVPTNAPAGSADYNRFMNNTEGVESIRFTGGYTNYAQGFGYNATRPAGQPFINSNFTLTRNPSTAIGGVINSNPDLFILLTDGQPNHPGTTSGVNPHEPDISNGNPAAMRAAVEAKQRYLAGTEFAGGFINPDRDEDTQTLAEVINGNPDSTADNIGEVTETATLSKFIIERIRAACEGSATNSNLTPVVGGGGVIVGSTKPEFSYNVTNASTSDPGGSNWRIMDLVLKPGASWACLGSGGGSSCDNIPSCAVIQSRIGSSNVTDCKDSTADAGGSSGNTGIIAPTGLPVSVRPTGPAEFQESWELGTQVCRVLVLVTPAQGVSNRVHGACAVIGKPPLVQVQGGDVRVGKASRNDTTDAGRYAGVYSSRFKLDGTEAPLPNGLVFGSWVEYGVMAPGVIRNTASLAAYRGGYDRGVTGDCKLEINKLTFANMTSSGSCGDYDGNTGKLLDVTSKFALDSAAPQSAGAGRTLNVTDANGKYRYTGTGTVTLTTSGDIGSGKHVYVYAPDATVTITGRVAYADGRYSTIAQIPQVVIVAKNINIMHSVTRVDAWLVAEGSTNGSGVVNTCTGPSGVTPRSFIGADRECRDQLVVNGPVIARELQLWRTAMYRDGVCKADTSGYRDNLTDCTKRVDRPAEIFNLPGSTILWALSQLTSAGGVRSGQVVEAPPIY